MDRTVAAETLDYYRNFSERDAFQDREKGLEDGYREYPETQSHGYSAHETYRISEARTAINNYVSRIRVELDKFDVKIRALRSKRDEDYTSRKADRQKEKAREIALLNATDGPDSEAFKILVAEQDRTVEAYRVERNRAKRDARIMLADQMTNISWLRWLTPYIALLGLLALLEVPVNNLAIELAFEFVPPVSYIIAFLVGVTFVLMAHFSGIQLLRIIDVRGWMKLVHIVLFLGLISLASFMVLILFEMRGQVSSVLDGAGSLQILQDGGQASNAPFDLNILEGSESADESGAEAQAPPPSARPDARSGEAGPGFFKRLFSDPLKAIFDIGAGSGITDEQRFAQVGLLLLNTLVLLLGTILSVMRHDRNADLEFTFMRQKRATEALNQFNRDFRIREARLQKDFSTQIAEIERQADEIHQDIISLQEQREQLKSQMENEMRYVTNTLMEQLSAYQAGNMQSRTTPTPVYFGRFGFVKLNEELLVRNSQ